MCPETLKKRGAELEEEWNKFKKAPQYLSIDRRQRPSQDWMRERRNELLGFLRQLPTLCPDTADVVLNLFKRHALVWAFDFLAHARSGEVFRQTAGLTEVDPYSCKPGDTPRPMETTIELLENASACYVSGPKKGEERKLQKGDRAVLIFDPAMGPNTVTASAYRLDAGKAVELALYAADGIITAVRNNPEWARDGLNSYHYLIPKMRDAMHHFKLWPRSDVQLKNLKREMYKLNDKMVKLDAESDRAFREGATQEQINNLKQQRASLQDKYSHKLYEYNDRLWELSRNQPLPVTDTGPETPRSAFMRPVSERTIAADEDWAATNLTIEQKLKQWREPADGLDRLRVDFHEYLCSALPGDDGERLCRVDDVLVRCGFHMPKAIKVLSQETEKPCDQDAVNRDVKTIYERFQTFLRKQGIAQNPI